MKFQSFNGFSWEFTIQGVKIQYESFKSLWAELETHDDIDTNGATELTAFFYNDDGSHKFPLVHSTFSRYENQLIILLVTYLEQIALDFVTLFFFIKKKGLIKNELSFEEIAHATSIEEFIRHIAPEAASRTIKSWKNTEILKKIYSLSNTPSYKRDNRLVEGLKNLVILRNRLVHGKSQINEENSQELTVTEGFQLLSKFIEVLTQIAKENNIPYDSWNEFHESLNQIPLYEEDLKKQNEQSIAENKWRKSYLEDNKISILFKRLLLTSDEIAAIRSFAKEKKISEISIISTIIKNFLAVQVNK